MRRSLISASLAGCFLAVPAAGQVLPTVTDSLRVQARAPEILAEARELAGHDRNAFVVAILTARTPNQAARYCELEERYHQALEQDFVREVELMFRAGRGEPAITPELFAEMAFSLARHYAEQRGMMSISMSARESDMNELGRACFEAKNALR
jgi:hypothetical protein